jgi:hypothetical protein
MKKIFYLLLVIFLNANAQEKEEFDYENIIVLAAIKDDKNCVFAGFPTFMSMRTIISNAESRFRPIVETPPGFIYELFLVDKNGTSVTLFLGDHWLSDGMQISHLSAADFSFLIRVINARKFENENSTLESLTLDVNVATLRNELLKTEDYESIRRLPDDANVNSTPEKAMPGLNTKPVDENHEKYGG